MSDYLEALTREVDAEAAKLAARLVRQMAKRTAPTEGA